MKKTLITVIAAVGLGFFGTPIYLANGHAAFATEAQLLVSHGAQSSTRAVNGYGTGPADSAGAQAVTESTAKKCWYVLDVQLCD
jgi:hypothetical protein